MLVRLPRHPLPGHKSPHKQLRCILRETGYSSRISNPSLPLFGASKPCTNPPCCFYESFRLPCSHSWLLHAQVEEIKLINGLVLDQDLFAMTQLVIPLHEGPRGDEQEALDALRLFPKFRPRYGGPATRAMNDREEVRPLRGLFIPYRWYMYELFVF